MTATASALSFYGIKVTPDELLRKCDSRGWDRHELETIDRIIESYGIKDESGYSYTMAQIKQHLKDGNPVIIHGMFTSSGHIVGVYGIDEEKGLWYVHDPAGKWDPDYHYGGPNWKSGEGVWYGSAWFTSKAAPDGKCWAHLLNKKKK